MKQHLLEIQDLSLSYGTRPILKSINFSVNDGEFFSLLGPSGCGKTSLLRLIAGFLPPTQGNILWNGNPFQNLPPQARDLNLVFQNYALFPHMNVFDNVAFGLKMKKLPTAEILSRTNEALELVRMAPFAQRKITELSGGQQQRIALARAVAPRPKLVLLDEPLGALDLQLRKQMQLELKTLQRQLGMTFVYVTHDQEEAFAMSDRIAILNHGHLEQVASPEVLYQKPASRFVAEFIGTANFLSATKINSKIARCKVTGTDFPIDTHREACAETAEILTNICGEILIRPEQWRVSSLDKSCGNFILGKVQSRHYLGAQTRYIIALEKDLHVSFAIDVPSHEHSPFEPSSDVILSVSSDARFPFYKDGTSC